MSKITKVDACARILRHKNFRLTIFKGDYNEFIKKGLYESSPPDIILCLANERNVWSTIQNNYPPVVYHATTTRNWGINFGRHVPTKEWCIMCRFRNQIEHTFSPICGEVQVKNSDMESRPALAVLPFLPAASSILVLAEMAKLGLQRYPVNGNFVQFSMKGAKNSDFMNWQRSPDPECYVCKSQHLDIYPQEIKNSLFWNL